MNSQPIDDAEATTQASAHPAEVGDASSSTQIPSPLNLQTFEASSNLKTARAIELLADVNLQVKIELGRTRLLVEDVLKLGEGAVVELDKLAGDPVDVYVNERHVARGEVLVLNDNFCIRINEILTPNIEAVPQIQAA